MANALSCNAAHKSVKLAEGQTVNITMENHQNENESTSLYPRATSLIMLGTGTSGILLFALH